MAYRPDPDLEILSQCTHDELDILVKLIQQEAKTTESLSSDSDYIKYQPNHIKYWKKIAEEIQRFGGNSIMNMMRSQGVLYHEICTDVASKLQIAHGPHDTTVHLESRIVLRLFEQAMESMSEEEKEECMRSINIHHDDQSQGIALGLATLQGGVHSGTIPPYQLFNVMAGAIGRQVLGQGIIFMGSVALTRAIGVLAGPIGWLLASAWAIIDFTSPAYRVTIPAVTFIASFRQRIHMQASHNTMTTHIK